MKVWLKYLVTNFITLTRLILTYIFIISLKHELTLNGQAPNITQLSIIFFIICFTDFIDGKIARYFEAVSVFGSIFDVVVDFIFIISSTTVLIAFRMIPIWFLVIIILKLTDFIITSKIINNNNLNQENVFIFDYLGRLAAFLFYVLPFVVLSVNKGFGYKSAYIIHLLLFVVSVISPVSSIQRLILCIKSKSVSIPITEKIYKKNK